jgi:hypothetical protein
MARSPSPKTSGKPKHVVALKHDKASRKNIPPAELQSTAELLETESPQPPAHYPRTRPLPAGERRPRDTRSRSTDHLERRAHHADASSARAVNRKDAERSSLRRR